MLKTEGAALDFQHSLRDLANVNEWKIIFDQYIQNFENKNFVNNNPEIICQKFTSEIMNPEIICQKFTSEIMNPSNESVSLKTKPRQK